MRTQLEIRDTDNSVLGSVDIGKDEDFPFTLTKKLASLKDISKRGGSYSKTFKVPATKENNKLLHYLYSSNQKVVQGFKQRKTANVLVDGKIIERGYVKITNIETKNKTDYYSMSFFGDNVEWMTELGEKDLTDLTYNNNAQTYNASSIIASWSGTYDTGYDHCYPWISYGQNENGYGLTIEDFFPAIYYKTIIERSLNSVGFTLNSTFLDGNFEKLIFPFVGGGFQHTEALVASKLFRTSPTNEYKYYCDFSPPDVPGSATNHINQGNVTIMRFSDDSTSPNFDTGGNYNTTTYKYTISTIGKYRFKIGAQYKQISGFGTQGGIKVFWHLYKNDVHLDRIEAPQAIVGSVYNEQEVIETGYYKFAVGDEIDVRVGYYGYAAEIRMDNSLTSGTFVVGETITGTTSGCTAVITDIFYQTTQVYLSLKDPVNSGGLLKFDFVTGEIITGASANGVVASIPDEAPSPSSEWVIWDKAETYWELMDMSRQLLDGNTYNISDVMPEIKILDLFSDVTKLFNLYWLTDNKTKTVYVEPRDSFFGGISDAIDWTDKLNIKNHSLKFISDYKRDLLFRYTKDDADKYMNNRNETMGGNSNYPNGLFLSYKHTFPDRFPKGTSTLTTEQIATTYIIHDPYSMPENSLNYGVTSAMWNESGEGAPEKSFGFKPRILNFQYTGQTYPDGSALYIDFDTDIYTSIPSALAVQVWDNTVPISLAFGQDDGLFYDHYSKTMAVIEDGAQLEAYFNLSDSDYQSLDIRKPIYLNSPEEVQGYWLIDTISDYSPFKPLTKVILMKYHNQDVERVTTDTNWAPDPFPTPTTGDYPVPPKEVITKGGKSMDGDKQSKIGVLINNGTGNQVGKGSGSVALGQGCIANYHNQTFLGKYPEISNDIIAIGVGTKNERLTGLRVSQDGDVSFYGGEVLVVNDNGERVPMFIEGVKKLKKIYLK